MSDFYKNYKSTIDKLIFLTTFIGFMYLFFNTIFSYVVPFVVGFLISLLIGPFVSLVTKGSYINRGMATIFAIVVLLLLIGLIFNLIISRILKEGAGFIAVLPQVLTYVTNTTIEFNKQFSLFYNLVPIELQEMLSEFSTNFITSISNFVGTVVKTTSTTVVTKVPNVLLGFVLSLVSSFFFTKDKALISDSVKKTIPGFMLNYAHILKEGIASAIMGYVKAQLIMMSIIATICVIGLMVLKIPYALFLGLIISVVDALPVFGSGFFYWPWIVFCLITGNYGLAAGLGIIYLLIFVTRQTLEPKVLGTQIGIHPLITLMSIYIGLRVFGFLGIFIGPCIIIIIKAVFEVPLMELGSDV